MDIMGYEIVAMDYRAKAWMGLFGKRRWPCTQIVRITAQATHAGFLLVAYLIVFIFALVFPSLYRDVLSLSTQPPVILVSRSDGLIRPTTYFQEDATSHAIQHPSCIRLHVQLHNMRHEA